MNESFLKLGSSRKIEKIEEIPALAIETRVLQEKRIMVIDDVRSVLVFFAPYFIAATGGEVSFVYFEKETLEELVDKISKNGITDVRNDLGAWTIVQAETPEAAAKMFENHPHFTIFPGESVEVMECLPMPGM